MADCADYTVIIPRADRAGPCNLAVDLASAAKLRGHRVRLLYLSGQPTRDDLASLDEVRLWRWSDLGRLSGTVHTHGLRPDVIGALLPHDRRRTLITTIHNLFLLDVSLLHSPWKVLPAWHVWARSLARFDHRICISQAMRRYYRRMLPGLEFEVAYNFTGPQASATSIEVERIREWIRARRERGFYVLAYVGALIPRKNVLRLIDAVARDPELSLVVCGGGLLREAVDRLVEERSLGPRVHVAGVVSPADRVTAECDMLVLPSRAEGLPLVVLEAARVGRPSLLSNIAVHREIAALGLGATFERHAFRDFGWQVRELVRRFGRGGHPDPAISTLWAEQFSPEPGYERYASILAGTSGARRR